MKRFLTCFAIAILILALLVCLRNETPVEVRNFYIDFMETGKTDLDKATKKYCYYSSPEEQEIAASSKDYLLSYRVKKWEELSSVLWAVTVEITTEYNTNKRVYTHFVGKMDNRYWVITGVSRLPDILSQSADLEEYLPTGDVVTFDELIIN